MSYYENNDEQEDIEAQENNNLIKEQVNKVGRDLFNTAKQQVQKVFREKLKKAIVTVGGGKIVLIIIIIIIVLPLFVVFSYVIDNINFGNGAEGAKTYTNSIDFSGGNMIISKDSVIKEALAQNGYTDEQIVNMPEEQKKKILGLENIDINNISSYDLVWEIYKDNYSQYSINKQEFIKLLNAELITEVLDLRQNPNEKIDWDNINIESGNIQGIVKVKRQTENNIKTLVYKDMTDFESLIKSNNYDALNYFSLDNENNMVIATYENTTYKVITNDCLDLIDTSKVNFDSFDMLDYKSFNYGNDLVSRQIYNNTEKILKQNKLAYKELIPDKYKMPFSYLWGLVVYSGDKQLALELADLIRESEIEITISDNIVNDETKDEYKYKKAKRTDTYATLNIKYNTDNKYEVINGDEIKNTNKYFSKLWKGPENVLFEDKFKGYNADYIDSQQSYENSNVEYTTTYIVNKEIDTISYNLTKANTWLFDYENFYTYSNDVEENNNVVSNEDWKFVTYDKNNVDINGRAKGFLEEILNLNENNARNNQRKELQQRLNNLNEQIENKQSEYDSLIKQINDLDKKSSNYKSQYDELTKKKNQIKKEFEELQKERDNFKDTTVKAFNSNNIKYLDGDIESVENVFYVRNEGISKNTSNKVTNYKYIQGTPKTTLKVDESDENNNFIKIMKKNKDASDGLLKLSDWMFEAMESDESTADMIDLTKFLFNSYSDTTIYGDIDEKSVLDWIEKSSFLNVNGSSMQEFIKKYVETWEGTSGESSDGKRYIVRDDGYGNLAVGRGVDIYNSGYLEQLKMACGGEIKSGTEIDKEIVDAIEFEILEEKSDKIKSMIQGLNLTDYQLAAIISRSYNCGDVGAVAVKRGNPALNFVDSYNRYWKDSDDLYEKEKTEGNFDHNLYKQYMSMPVTSNGQYSLGVERRRKSEWTLFQTGYGDVINERYNDKGGSSSIIEIADRIDRYMAQNSYSYSLNVNMLATTFEKSKSYKATCCATYVSWVLQEAGYIDEASHVNNVSGICRVLENVGWKKITSFEDLQPGDVMIQANNLNRTYGHTQIYAGKSTNGNIDIYSAGYDGEVKAIGPSTVSESVQKSKFNWGYRPK